MHKGLLQNLRKIRPDQLGVLKDCVAVLGKSDAGSLYKLLNNESNNWWWTSVSKKEITPNYYAVVLFLSYIDYNQRMSLKMFQSLMKSKIDHIKAPISATICGIMIGNIVFVKDIYNDKSYKFDFKINTEDDVPVKSIGIAFDNICFKGLFNLKTCPFYCNIQF